MKWLVADELGVTLRLHIQPGAKKTEDGDTAPRELPRLPLPPPADPE